MGVFKIQGFHKTLLCYKGYWPRKYRLSFLKIIDIVSVIQLYHYEDLRKCSLSFLTTLHIGSSIYEAQADRSSLTSRRQHDIQFQ